MMDETDALSLVECVQLMYMMFGSASVEVLKQVCASYKPVLYVFSADGCAYYFVPDFSAI